MIPISYNLRNLAVRKATTIATASGVALVVFVFASALMLSNSIERTLGRSAASDVAIVLRKGADAELSSSIEDPNVSLVMASSEVAKGKDGAPLGVGEVVVVVLLDKLGTDGISNVQVRGVPDHVFAFRPDVKIIAGRPAQPGSDEVIVGKAIRGRFKGVDLGQSFELRKNRPVKVVGIFEDSGSSYESEIWGDRHTVGLAFGREGLVSSVRVRLTSAAKFDSFAANITEQNKQLGLEAMRESVYYEKQSEKTNEFITGLGKMIAGLFSIGAMIGAMITMYAAVAHRQREIGTLRALGFSKLTILMCFLIESTVLALLGGVVGIAGALALQFVKFSIINFASFSEIVFTFEPTLEILARSVGVAALMGILGGFVPAYSAAKLNPVQAMRG